MKEKRHSKSYTFTGYVKKNALKSTKNSRFLNTSQLNVQIKGNANDRVRKYGPESIGISLFSL